MAHVLYPGLLYLTKIASILVSGIILALVDLIEKFNVFNLKRQPNSGMLSILNQSASIIFVTAISRVFDWSNLVDKL